MISDAGSWGASDPVEQRREEFLHLLDGQTKSGTSEASERVHDAVRTLAQQALSQVNFLGGNVKRTIEALIYELDRKLCEQLDQILHHQDFRELEASWRGLWFTCSRSVESARPVIQVLDVTKAELLRDSHGRDFRQSALVRRVHMEPLCTPGGTPYNAILADYDITDDALDFALLAYFGRVGRLANAPFALAASPELLGLTSFQEMEGAARIALRRGGLIDSFRHADEARFVSLAMPRILLRKPYASRPGDQPWFRMREEIYDRNSYLWGRSVWALGSAIITAGMRTGWFADVTSDEDCKVISGLPRHETVFKYDVMPSLVGPVEHVLSYRREREVAALGLTPISQADGYAVLNWARTLYEGEHIDATGMRSHCATAESDLRAVLCACRFAHAASKIWHDVRPLRGTAQDVDATPSREQALALWIQAHTATHGRAPSPLRPLARGTVVVEATSNGLPPWLAMLELWPGYGFDEPGPVRLQVGLEVRYPETRTSHAAVRIAAVPVGDAAAVPAFRLRHADASERADEVVQACTSRLAEARCPPYRIVLGPLTIHATVDARRSLDELVEAVLADNGGLELDISAHLADVSIDLSRIGLLVHYPSGIVRGLSATLRPDGERHVLRLFDPVALLDPGARAPARPGSPIDCVFDILAVEAVAVL